jgi:hypothetical protein
MKIHTIEGVEVEITMEEAKRIHGVMAEHASHSEKSHNFIISDKPVVLTEHEMKEISNMWWEHYGKSGMQTFFENYQLKAAENIRKALGHCNVPVCEKDVKAAIAQAVTSGDPCLIAEVMFESMEWCNTYIGLQSITED